MTKRSTQMLSVTPAGPEAIANRKKPFVYIEGEIPTTKDDVLATMRVISEWMSFFAYIKIKCQGTSSMTYDKKNFTVTLYQDEARTIPLYITVPGWKHASNKFVLKANWIDHLHARNIICARLWSEVVASRADYGTMPEELRNSPNNGAVDGFPIIVYTNGSYQGLYTWNIGKDAWMVGMDESNANHVLLSNESNSDATDSPSNFRVLWDGETKYYDVEVGEITESVKSALNAVINCTMTADDETFKATIGSYLDVQSAIDYYLHQYVICGIDGLAKNMLLATYDMVKWYMCAYDMDSTWGLWWNGQSFVAASTACPDGYQEKRNLLFERINTAWKDEVLARYHELRNSVYSYGNIVSKFERFCGQIDKETYEDDLIPYADIPSADTNNIWQIRDFVRDRLAYCDNQFLPEGAFFEYVEYIESDGASWIDTELTLDNDMVIDCSIYNPENELDYENYFGTRGSDFSFRGENTAPSSYVRVYINGTNRASLFFTGGVCAMAGVEKTLSFDLSLADIEWTSVASLWLFAVRKTNTVVSEPEVPGTFRLYRFKVSRKSTEEVLLDMLPAIDNNGVPGMYDSVTQKMFYNSGTGAFSVPSA